MQKTAFCGGAARGGYRRITKTLLVMKLTTVLLLAAMVNVSAKSFSQNISFSGKDVPLKEVFNAVKKQSGYVFLYTEDVLRLSNPVSVSVSNFPLDQFLERVFASQPLDYRIDGRSIFINLKERTVSSPPEKPAPERISKVATDNFIPVRGRILDEEGKPLTGATILIKGGKSATITDAEGMFTVQAEIGQLIHISFVGRGSVELKLVSASSIIVVATDLQLDEEEGKTKTSVPVIGQTIPLRSNSFTITLPKFSSKLDEMVVIAYGTNTQRYNVGNVTTVTAKDIAKSPVTDPLLALQGRVPGMTINQVTGVPGSEVKVNIRGLNSLTAGSNPLFIVDGVPYSQNVVNTVGYGAQQGASALNFINPADIESISVLKDADATAIYGSRGANGVVLITTKKAKAGDMRVDLNVYHGVQSIPLKKIRLMNNSQYLAMRREAFYQDSMAAPAANIKPTIDNAPDLVFWDTAYQMDLKKIAIGNNASTTNASLSISGGNEQVQYLLGATYNRQTTSFPGNHYQQNATIRFALSGVSLNKKFRTSLSGSYNFIDQNLPNLDLTMIAMRTPPNFPPFLNPDGTLNFAPNPITGRTTTRSPHQYAQMIGGRENPARSNNLVASLDLNYTILPGLVVKTTMGYNKQTSTPSVFVYSYIWDPADGPHSADASYGNGIGDSWIVEPQLSYTKQIGNGKLLFLLGSSFQVLKQSAQHTGIHNITSDLMIRNLSGGVSSVYGSSSEYRYTAAFSKINYELAGKYLLNISLRRDGSSRFGDDRKFSNFWAAGAGWIFSEERAIRDALPVLSYGKLRASYGITGNDQIGDYGYLDRYQIIDSWNGGGSIYQGAIGLAQVSLFNPNYEWEKTTKLEFGLEAGFFKDRLLVNFSHYINKSSNQLQSLTLPGMVGATTVSGNIPATIQNKGLEIMLSTDNVHSKDFNWRSTFNISFQQNRLLEYTGTDSRFQQMVGKSLSIVYLSHYLGVDPAQGRFLFADAEGKPVYADGAVDPRAVAIDLAPRFFGGLENTFTYKRFTASVFFQYTKQKGPDASMGDPAYSPGGIFNQWTYLAEDRWHKPGDIAKRPRYSQNGSLNYDNSIFFNSDGAYTDASYIRCKNISLSWELPDNWTNKVWLKRCRLYIQVHNAFTITQYKGSDPETLSYNNLPPLRIYTGGIQLSL
ncbi:SusC/RagA family TonB-linked outer membrane protein [Pseudobacter ginsenosidimutans]|uniref:TonB-linked SusC/RagA family outer membrane protein n=1 Tax=Pseudobacter ginsenosidimutans TaxID=661488 RepID=A0A4Q7MB57_9BACT|nr:SusC/RagA family TonB-linked outer membrane protein [Pseudobacter ginsenosidimutans]RZS65435.1 TonB-linked SusC/RagA family outer membrane protein [Pseudobacter ginsenosidimutans]